MRIYAVADLHARPGLLEAVKSNVIRYRPDVLVAAGDIASFFHPDRVLGRLSKVGVPVFAVRGNTDLRRMEWLFRTYDNIVPLHLNRVVFKGISFTGLSGTLPVPFRTRIGIREKALIQKCSELLDRQSVLVVHPPPYGVLDQVMGKYHAGSRSVAGLVERKQPLVVLCGHIHEAFGCARMGDTKVVNCNVKGKGRGALIEIGKNRSPEIEMLAGG